MVLERKFREAVSIVDIVLDPVNYNVKLFAK